MSCCSYRLPPIIFFFLPDGIGGIQKYAAEENIQQSKRNIHGNEAVNHTADKNDAEDQTKIKVTHTNNLLYFCMSLGFLFTMQAYTKIPLRAGMSTNGRFLTTKKWQAAFGPPTICRSKDYDVLTGWKDKVTTDWNT